LAPIDPTKLLPTGITCSFPDPGKPFTRKKTAEKQYLYIRYVIITKLNFSSFCHFCLCCAANGFPEMELGTKQERQMHGADNKVLVPYYMYECRISGKTLLQMEKG
jgi:hypothetical protein